MEVPNTGPSKHHAHTRRWERPFGHGSFGAFAEGAARLFGTPRYLISQTLLVIAWIAMNAIWRDAFDPYPFILLNLAFSLQAAYAAPLILLAETRQAERDKVWGEADAHHREELSERTLTLLQQNTELTREVQRLSQRIADLTSEIHGKVVAEGR